MVNPDTNNEQTYWQTETGSNVITPLAGVTPTKPGSASFPFFGIEPAIIDPVSGEEIHGNDVEGVLAFKQAWPSMARTVYGAHKRYMDTYLNVYKGYYVSSEVVRGTRLFANRSSSSLVTVPAATTRVSTGSEDVSTTSSTLAVIVCPPPKSKLPSSSTTPSPKPLWLVSPTSSQDRLSMLSCPSRMELRSPMRSARSSSCKCARASVPLQHQRPSTSCRTCPRLAAERLCDAF